MQYNGTFEKYNLTVNNEQKFYETKLTNKYVFKIKRSHHYIGGVNPTFDKTYLPFNIPYSFKGILKHSTGLESLSMKNGVEREHDVNTFDLMVLHRLHIYRYVTQLEKNKNHAQSKG